MKATAGVGFAACDPATLWTPRLTRKAGLVEETNCPRRGTQDLHFGIPAGWECALPQGIFRSPLRAIALPDRGWGLGAAEQGVGAAGQGEWVLGALWRFGILNCLLPSPLKGRRCRGRDLRYTYFRHLPPTTYHLPHSNYLCFQQHSRCLPVSPLFSNTFPLRR